MGTSGYLITEVSESLRRFRHGAPTSAAASSTGLWLRAAILWDGERLIHSEEPDRERGHSMLCPYVKGTSAHDH